MMLQGRSAGPASHPAQNWPNVEPDPFATCADFSIPSSQETPDIFQNSYNSDIPDTCMDEFNQVDLSIPSSQDTPEGWYLNQSLNSTPNLDFYDDFNPECVDFSVPSSQETPEGWYLNQSLNSTPNLDFSDEFNPDCVDFSVPSSQETPEEWYLNQCLNSTPNLDFCDEFNPDCVDFSVPSSQETPEGWYLDQSLNSTPDLDFDFSCPDDQGRPPSHWGYCDDPGEIPPCPSPPRQQVGLIFSLWFQKNYFSFTI